MEGKGETHQHIFSRMTILNHNFDLVLYGFKKRCKFFDKLPAVGATTVDFSVAVRAAGPGETGRTGRVLAKLWRAQLVTPPTRDKEDRQGENDQDKRTTETGSAT